MAATTEVRSPADGTLLGSTPDQTREETEQIVDGVRRHQREWEALPLARRAAWLKSYRDWLLDNEARLAMLLQSETGKPWAEATLDLSYVVQVINYYTAHARGFLKEGRPKSHGLITAGKRQTLRHRPYPVVGVITPWNFPLALPLIDSVPALLAGAAVVVKPSEFTPLAVSEAIRGWREIGAPAVFEVVTGQGSTGSALVDQVDYVQFTGSSRTGRAIAKQAAERLIPVGLELGGKDPMIVLDDADLERAANAAVWGGIANAGQMCTSVERVYVEAPVYDDFVARVTEQVRLLRVGQDGQDYRFDVTPLATAAQLAIVERHVDDALAKGAKALVGGSSTGIGTFFEPTVLVDVDHSMLCMSEETFGPTLPIMKVADADEAVALANDSAYGLSATVFSGDRARADSVARRLEVGGVNVNDVFSNLFTLPLPQAGWKQSGMGARLGGAHGILKYCRSQAIVTTRLQLKRELVWYPYTPRRGNFARRVSRFLGAQDLRRRLGRTGKRS